MSCDVPVSKHTPTVTHSLAVRMSAAWQDPTTASQAVPRGGSTPHRTARYRLRRGSQPWTRGSGRVAM